MNLSSRPQQQQVQEIHSVFGNRDSVEMTQKEQGVGLSLGRFGL